MLKLFNKMKKRERSEKAEATVNILGHFNSSIIKTTSVAAEGGGAGGGVNICDCRHYVLTQMYSKYF